MNFGLGMPNLAESGVKMTCKVKIVGLSAQTYTLEVRVIIKDGKNFTENTLIIFMSDSYSASFVIYRLFMYHKSFSQSQVSFNNQLSKGCTGF